MTTYNNRSDASDAEFQALDEREYDEPTVERVAAALEAVAVRDLGPDGAFPMEDYARAAIDAMKSTRTPTSEETNR